MRSEKLPISTVLEEDQIVTASGSIASSRLDFDLKVTNNSTNSLPSYRVEIKYEWNKKAYVLALFVDNIPVVWGGGLNTKSFSTSATFSRYDLLDYTWKNYTFTQGIGKTETPNSSIIFKLPQYIGEDPSGGTGHWKTQKGSMAFTLYQTKRDGKDTKILSNYCHRVISVLSANITASSSPSISLSIGGAWDVTPQVSGQISY